MLNSSKWSKNIELKLLKQFPTSQALKITKKGNMKFIHYNQILPKISLKPKILNLYTKEIKKNPQKMVSFSCTKKKISQNNLNKQIYIFDSFFFIDQNEVPSYEDEYNIISYSLSENQCEIHFEHFLKEINSDINYLNFDNFDSDFEEGKERVVKLNIIDQVYLQNFRIFFRYGENKFEFILCFPKINLSFCEIKMLKFSNISLSSRLISRNNDNPLVSKTFGFITLDQRSRIYPLFFDDEKKYQYPLCGVWVFGFDFTENVLENSLNAKKYLWALIIYFLKNKKIKDRLPLLKKTGFLFLAFQKNKKCQSYIIKVSDNTKNMLIDSEHFTLKIEKTEENKNNIDFSELLFKKEQEETSFNIITSESLESKEKSKKSFMVNSGIQVDLKDLQKSQDFKNEDSVSQNKNYKEMLENYRTENEKFFMKTIKSMQDQMNMLSQTIFSINQQLLLINQRLPPQNFNNNFDPNKNFVQNHNFVPNNDFSQNGFRGNYQNSKMNFYGNKNEQPVFEKNGQDFYQNGGQNFYYNKGKCEFPNHNQNFTQNSNFIKNVIPNVLDKSFSISYSSQKKSVSDENKDNNDISKFSKISKISEIKKEKKRFVLNCDRKNDFCEENSEIMIKEGMKVENIHKSDFVTKEKKKEIKNFSEKIKTAKTINQNDKKEEEILKREEEKILQKKEEKILEINKPPVYIQKQEYNENNKNNQSIPIPKINPRFRQCFSNSESENSDSERNTEIKLKMKNYMKSYK